MKMNMCSWYNKVEEDVSSKSNKGKEYVSSNSNKLVGWWTCH